MQLLHVLYVFIIDFIIYPAILYKEFNSRRVNSFVEFLLKDGILSIFARLLFESTTNSFSFFFLINIQEILENILGHHYHNYCYLHVLGT